MTCPTVQAGDIGTKFLVTVTEEDAAGELQTVDISSATTKEITLQPPSPGTPITKAASFETDGTDGQMFILSEAGDLATAGSWQVQGRIAIAGGEWRTKVGLQHVAANL